MSDILSRDEFGLECDKFKNGEEVNEGLLQFLKSFIKQDWRDIRSNNPELKKELEKIDKSLDGYTFLKRSNYDACSTFRQALCDFANELLDLKLHELEKSHRPLKKVLMGIADDEDKIKSKLENSKELNSILGKGSIKDKAMAEKLHDVSVEVDSVIKKNPQIAPWANTMKRSVKNLINSVIIAKSDADDKEDMKKALEKKKKDDQKWLESQNDKGLKSEKQKIEELTKNREEIIKEKPFEANPLKGMDGNKAITTLFSEFKRIIDPIKDRLTIAKKESASDDFDDELALNEGKKTKLIDDVIKAVGADNHFGFAHIMKVIGDIDYENFSLVSGNEARKRNTLIRIFFNECGEIFSRIEGLTKRFDEVPSDAIQSMFMGIAYSIAYGLTGDKSIYNDNVIELLARCCIEKDATVGYSFPLVNEKQPKVGTIYVALMNQLKKLDDNNGFFNRNNNLLNAFRKNIEQLFNEILKKAEELKKTAEEKREEEEEALRKKEEEENK